MPINWGLETTKAAVRVASNVRPNAEKPVTFNGFGVMSASKTGGSTRTYFDASGPERARPLTLTTLSVPAEGDEKEAVAATMLSETTSPGATPDSNAASGFRVAMVDPS